MEPCTSCAQLQASELASCHTSTLRLDHASYEPREALERPTREKCAPAINGSGEDPTAAPAPPARSSMSDADGGARTNMRSRSIHAGSQEISMGGLIASSLRLLTGQTTCETNFTRLSISFLNERNRDFDEKVPSNSLSKWLSNIHIR
jgi:hypothetical protein